MTDGPTPVTNKSATPAVVRGTKAAQQVAGTPATTAKPRGMTYGGISAAQHALERLERATRQSKNGRRV